MLNQLILQGRLTKDIESRTAVSGKEIYSFTLATDNRMKNPDGTRGTTFINCTAFENVGSNLMKYCGVGDMICVIGAIHQRNYITKEGEKRNVIEVLVDSVEFLQPKKEPSPEENNAAPVKEEPKEDLRNLEGTSELPPLPEGWHYNVDGKPVKDAPSKKNAPAKK